MSFTAPEDAFLDVNDAHLRVYGNVHADGLKLGQLEVVTTTSTGSTINFLHQHTAFTTTSNIDVGTTNHELFVDTNLSRVGILTNTPGKTLDVNGEIRGTFLHGDGSNISNITSSQWTTVNSNEIHYAGNVGIGLEDPAFKLDVDGDINFTGTLREDGNPFVSTPWTIESGPTALSYTGGNVGIGAGTPSAKLEVTGNAHVSTDLTVAGKIGVGVDSPAANLQVVGNCHVSTNMELGGTLVMGTVTVEAQHALSAITATGNTTPHTVEFQNAGTSLVTTGNVQVGKELHMQYTDNVAKIQANSNVVTEFSRSKKLIKYPRVAMTGQTTSNHTVTGSSWYGSGANYEPWKAFDNVGNHSSGQLAWYSFDYSGTDAYSGTDYAFNPSHGGTATPVLFTGAVQGEWLKIQLPDKIALDHYIMYGPNQENEFPRDWTVYGSVDGTNWNWIDSRVSQIFGDGTGTSGTATGKTKEFYLDTLTNEYLYFAFVFTRGSVNRTEYIGVGEIELYGVPEYDPEAYGTDVTLKSKANVPNTDWLKVYYDAKDLENGPVSTTAGAISGLGGTTNNGTAHNGVTVSDGAFVFDGTDDYITTSALGFSGDQVHSVSLWFWSDKPQTDMTTEHGIYSIGYGNSIHAGLSWWSPVTVPGSALRFWHDGSGGKNFPGTTFLEGKWNHIVVVYPGDGADNIRIWLNGVEITGVQATSVNSDFNWSTGDTIVIGDWYTNVGPYLQSPWDGKIANFRLFNRVITSDEIYQLYAYQKEYFGHSTNNLTLKAGRLGIGTSEPRAALDVRGRIAREYNPGEIIEELNAICDGSTVTVQSGSYKMANITVYQNGTESHQVITGSTINYTPPPGTKRVYYRFWFKWDAYANRARSHFQFQIDDVVVTPSKNSISSASGSDHQAAFPVSVEYTIICNHHSDDASNGKFKSWTSPKELECTFRDYSHPDDKCLIHVNEWTDGTVNDSIQKPHLTIRAIA